jgi:integrase
MAGHIKKRVKADGTASYQARLPRPTNRRKDVVKTFDRKKDAERWLSNAASSMDRGEFIEPRRGETLFGAVAEEWKGTWADLAPKTQVGYESILNRHVLPAFAKARVASITPRDVQDFANGLGSTRSPNTVRRVMDVLRNVLRVAVERRYIGVSPCEGVRLARKGDGRTVEINPLTHGEVRTLVALLPGHWRLPVLLDVYTGLRAGELWALRRSDVNALRGEILVDEALKEVTTASAAKVPDAQRITDSLIVGPTKTYAVRKVSVPAFLRDELAAHLSRSLPGGDGPDAFIFTTPTGEAIRHNLFYKRIFAPTVTQAFPGRTPVPRPPPYVRGLADRGRSAPATDQAPPRAQRDPYDDGHLRPPVPERRAGAGWAARCRVSGRRRAGRGRYVDGLEDPRLTVSGGASLSWTRYLTGTVGSEPDRSRRM